MSTSSPTTPLAVSEGRTPAWVGPLQGTLLGLLVSLSYYRIIISMVNQWWHDSNYSHGFFVPLFATWAIWKERKELGKVPLKPTWHGLFVILAGLAVLVVGVLGAENFLSRSSLLFVLAGIIIYFYGWPLFRAASFPWACLFLMIPIPVIIFNEAALPLQFQASKLASGLLNFVGVPVLREGNVIHLPALTLDVVE